MWGQFFLFFLHNCEVFLPEKFKIFFPVNKATVDSVKVFFIFSDNESRVYHPFHLVPLVKVFNLSGRSKMALDTLGTITIIKLCFRICAIAFNLLVKRQAIPLHIPVVILFPGY